MAAERLVAGLTQGRGGVKSTICRALTRNTAGIPPGMSRAIWQTNTTRGRRPGRPQALKRDGLLGLVPDRASTRARGPAGSRGRSLHGRGPTGGRRGSHTRGWLEGGPNSSCTTGVSGMEQPEPSTKNVRCPCQRPSSETVDGPLA